ncbi:MAG TPA: GntR family transcriptional regulator [Streptosporangiaceae bacterium]|nr:GntR family transcriptional regulator [Streptosporangiaceae bacterium]
MHHSTEARPEAEARAEARTRPEPGLVRSLPARHRVKLILHRGILSGVIPGGTRLVQSSIAEELAVSTRPVRDALRELAAAGFVRLDDRGAAVVHELGRSDLEDIYQIRKMLEPVAAARAAGQASEACVLRAVELLATMEAETDGAQWAEYNSGFHGLLDEAASSPRLAAILGNLRELSALYVRHAVLSVPDRARQASAEHEEILRAIIARDPSAAADAAVRHLNGTLRALTVRRLDAGR